MCACVCELPVYSRRPSKSTVPSSGRSSPANVYSKVVFPAPEAPTRKTASLRRTSIEMPRNTSIRRGPIRNERRKSRATKCGVPFSIAPTLSLYFGRAIEREISYAGGSSNRASPARTAMLNMAAGHICLSIARRSGRSTLVVVLIYKPERNQQWPVDRPRHRQVILYLVILNRRPRYRTEHAINCFTEVSELLQRVLHIGDDLVRRQTVITVDRPIVSVVRIVGIVAVSRIPITQVPRVKPAAD